MFATMPAQEIKRRGMSVLNADLANGPVYVISNNTPKYVVMLAEDFKRMRHEAFVRQCREAMAEYRAGNYKSGTVEDLMADIMDGMDDED